MNKPKKEIICPEQINSIWKFYPVVRPSYKSVLKNYFPYFSSKTYVVGTQKNRLNEAVLLSTQHTCLN